jgi:hypothetical protein
MATLPAEADNLAGSKGTRCQKKTCLKIRLSQPLRGFGARLLPQGEVLEASIDNRAKVVVRGGTYRLPLRLDQWELVLTDEDLE